MRGLAGLPRPPAKVLKGYFSSQGVSLESMVSKPEAGLPSLQHQNQEGNPNNMRL